MKCELENEIAELETLSLQFMEKFFVHLDNKEINKLYLGLAAMAYYRRKEVDQLLFRAAGQQLLNSSKRSPEQLDNLNGYFSRTNYSETLNERIVKEFHTNLIEDLSGLGNTPREGNKIGLFHGHFRMLTLAHMFNFIEAKRQCDTLVVLIESNERGKIFKNKESLIHDANRLKSIVIPEFADYTGLIRGYLYNNDFYYQLANALKPDIYFSSDELSSERKLQRQRTADLVGAECRLLSHLPGISTSIFETLS